MFLSLGMANLMGKMMEKQAKRKGTKPLILFTMAFAWTTGMAVNLFV